MLWFYLIIGVGFILVGAYFRWKAGKLVQHSRPADLNEGQGLLSLAIFAHYVFYLATVIMGGVLVLGATLMMLLR